MMNADFKKDYYRMTGKKWNFIEGHFQLIFGHRLRFMKHFRKIQKRSKKLSYFYHRICMFHLSRKYGIEIHPSTRIGSGFALFHPYNITVNPEAIIGNNVNISKGATIGMECRGIRRGSPIIGNKVFIGINATIVGKISIGDDVLIAPNSYVNCDVPSHSIVIGNPCKIISKENATHSYVNFLIEDLKS